VIVQTIGTSGSTIYLGLVLLRNAAQFDLSIYMKAFRFYRAKN